MHGSEPHVCRPQIRRTQRASVFPVGLILGLGVSSPVVRGGKVVGFHDSFQVGENKEVGAMISGLG